jgi:hypothetical protein
METVAAAAAAASATVALAAKRVLQQWCEAELRREALAQRRTGAGQQ